VRLARAGGAWAALVCGALALLACGGEPAPEPGRLVAGELDFAPRTERIGAFELRLEGTGWSDARLVVSHRDRPGEPVLATPPGEAFLEIARGRAEVVPGGVTDRVQERCRDLSVDGIEAELFVLRVSGRLRCTVLERGFELFLVPEGGAELRVHARMTDASFNRMVWVAERSAGERFHGLGARDTLDVTGRRVPVWVGEARAEPPGLVARVGRRVGLARAVEPPSPAPVPHLLGSRGRALWLENDEPSVFDLRAAGRLRVEVLAPELTFRLQVAGPPLARVALATAAAGRIGPLPGWAHAGPWIVAGGGSDAVRDLLGELAAAGVAPAAVELRDWYGAGSLDPDPARYPDAVALVAELARDGVRTVVATEPRLPDEGGDAAVAALRAEADAAGHWVLGPEGAPLVRDGRRFVDLTSPDARAWWADALRAHAVDRGVAGLVVRGGASLPGEARLADDASGIDRHDAWADAGVAAARRAFEAAGRGDGAVLSAHGFVRSPSHGMVLLAGDAGDPAAWTRALSAGLSGFAYAALDVRGGLAPEARGRALGAAALAPIFRVEAEALDGPEARAVLAAAARLHAAWRDFRAELVRQASERGAPVLRAPFLHFPDARPGEGTAEAFLVGDHLLVAPVFEPGAERVEVALPAGRWVDVWTGEVHGRPGAGTRVAIDAPGGRAALLHPEGSLVGRRLARALAGGS
jgi:alpha-glucosidase